MGLRIDVGTYDLLHGVPVDIFQGSFLGQAGSIGDDLDDG